VGIITDIGLYFTNLEILCAKTCENVEEFLEKSTRRKIAENDVNS